MIQPVSEISDQNPGDALWCIVGNVVEERAYGPGGVETRRGTKHFRPGAKVHIIDWYPGGSYAIVVVGQHRRSRSFIKVVMNVNHVENLRVKMIYNPKVIEIASAHADERGVVLTQERAQEIASTLPHWQA
jgi:hypothetical protein